MTFLLRSGFGYMAQHLWPTATYYEMPNVKRDCTKRNSVCKGKEEASNKEFKVKAYKKAYKKASMSVSPTNLCNQIKFCNRSKI